MKESASMNDNKNQNLFDTKNTITKKKDNDFINNHKVAARQKRISIEEKVEIVSKRYEIEECSRNRERLRKREYPKITSAHASDEASNLTMLPNQYLNKNHKAAKKELHKAACKIDSLQCNNEVKDDKIKALESLVKKQQSLMEEKEYLLKANQLINTKLQQRMQSDRMERLDAKNDAKEKRILQQSIKEMKTSTRNLEVEYEEVDKLKNEAESTNTKLSRQLTKKNNELQDLMRSTNNTNNANAREIAKKDRII